MTTALHTDTAAFDLHRSADWLATQDLHSLDAHRADLVSVVDAAARAAGAPAALRPTDADSTPTLVRLYNRHASTILQSQRLAA